LKLEKPISTFKKINGLDSLRFFAFFSVFIGHATHYLEYGFIYSIHLFFVLSSFLLTYLVLNEVNTTGRISIGNFFIRRGLRIYPLYYLIIAFAFIGVPIIEKYTNQKITLPPNKLTYLFFVSNFDYSDHIFPLKFLWSIAVEEQFYIIFILLTPLFKKYFYTAILILIAFYISFRIYSWQLHYDYFDVWLNPLSYFIHYAAGMIAAKLYFENKIPSIKKLLALAGSLLVIVLIMDLNKTSQLFDAIPLSVFFCCLILIVIESFKNYEINNKFIRITEYLGKYTYGLYVYSGFVIAFFITKVPIQNIYLKTICEFAVLLAIAWLSYHFYEEKFLKLKKRFNTGRIRANRKKLKESPSFS
jgi:peptidoglycan/LPS O-acetylase OafA/YrhL